MKSAVENRCKSACRFAAQLYVEFWLNCTPNLRADLHRREAATSLLAMEGEDAELISHPTRVGIYGQSGCGKTHLVTSLLKDPRLVYERVIWLCPEYSMKQPDIAALAEEGKIKRKGAKAIPFLAIPCTPGWPERLEQAISEGEYEDKEGRKKFRPQLVVLDDLIGKSGTSEGRIFNELFTGGRHRGLSVFELLQRIFPNGNAREHRLNCEMHVVFNLGAADEAGRLFRQTAPRQWRALETEYGRVTSQNPHGAIWVDQRHHKKWPGLRFRTGLETCLVLPDSS